MDGTRGRKKVKSMSIDFADNGGAVVRHEYDNRDAGPSYMPGSTHAFTDRGAFLRHVGKHYPKRGGGDFTTTVDPDSRKYDRDARDTMQSPRAMAGGQKAAPSKKAGRRAAKKRGGGVD